MAPQPNCYAPFVQMLLSPTGKLHPCCYHFGYKLGSAAASSWDQLWNGLPMQRLREDSLCQGKICRSRIKNLACHKHFTHWEGKVSLDVVQKSPPKRLDIRLNGACNLRCIMCDVWQQPNQVYDNSSFWTEGPQNIFPYLEEVEILGGEPFIQQDTFKLIDAIVAIQPHCRFSFITNGLFLNRTKVFSTLSRIKLHKIQVSIDSFVSKTYQKIRRGGNLDLLLNNLKDLENLLDQPQFANTRKVASMCILQQNWQEVPIFIDKAEKRGWEVELQLAYYDPSQQASLTLLSKQQLESILTFFKNLPNRYKKHVDLLQGSLHQILSRDKF